MTIVRLKPEPEVRAAAAAAFERHRAKVLEALPGAQVDHVGATAVPGSVTKGDVDLLVLVSADDFAAAVEALDRLYARHQTENWSETFASFTAPPVGVQLALEGSEDAAMFTRFRDALTSDPALLAEYNTLKRGLDGEDYERYTERKGRWIERVLS